MARHSNAVIPPVETPENPKEKEVKIKALKLCSGPEGHYFPGRIYTVSPKMARSLIDAGAAERVNG